MKKLYIILALTLLSTTVEAKQRNCSGCRWCAKKTPKLSTKKHSCDNCQWCIKKKKRLEKKENKRSKKKVSSPGTEEKKEKEKFDPDLLAQKLIHAIKTNQSLETMEQLIDQGANLDYEDKEQRTPLHWAAVYAEPFTVGLLLVHNADIEAVDYRGNTPLHLVSMFRPNPSKRKEIVQDLIFEGASIYERNEMGLNVLEAAVDMDLRRYILLTSLKPTFVPGQISF